MNPITLEFLAREHHQHLLREAGRQRCAHLAQPFKWPQLPKFVTPAAPTCTTC
ncbi:hypothetical protein [Deinococcus multiflagellatus]|uniref:Uncharacterized protein n=1 Tax=Deinococcus multiflagellatus TaxID=1656887 RepID=A0ABW1ZT16_9DEIO|nr:hypothetical protein [Deinococcus multiflagellatus]MBZ9715648.1 hypothetical protein [Deinococcus multiflagellatus]